MKSTRLSAYLLACAVFASSVLVYVDYIYMLGFPDGFITELEYAERRLAYIFIAVSMALGLCFIYLSVAAGRKAVGKKLSAAVVLYLAFIVGISLLDRYYRLHLMDGTGG